MRILYTPVKSVDWAALDRIPGLCWEAGQKPSGYIPNRKFLFWNWNSDSRLTNGDPEEEATLLSWPEFLKEVRKEMGVAWEQEDL